MSRGRAFTSATAATSRAAQQLDELPTIVPGAGGCWIWTLSRNRKGYGRWWWRGPDRGRLAHVVVWGIFNGPLAENLELDHLCRIRACVNPAHLEPVDGAENRRRRDQANGWRTRRAT